MRIQVRRQIHGCISEPKKATKTVLNKKDQEKLTSKDSAKAGLRRMEEAALQEIPVELVYPADPVETVFAIFLSSPS
jgi:hypothetical protein